jgi:hypothetical protein
MAITKCLISAQDGEPVHSNGESVAPAWPHQRRMVRAGLMEKIMSKTNDTSYDVAATSERELAEAELDFVAGGFFGVHYYSMHMFSGDVYWLTGYGETYIWTT